MKMSNAKAWFRGLSRVAKIGVVFGTGITMLSVGGAIADSPTVTYEQQSVIEIIPFTVSFQDDDSMMATDPHKIVTTGVNGSQKVTYRITKSDGIETAREAITTLTISKPVAQVESVGTKTVTNQSLDETIPFEATTKYDNTVAKGSSSITTAGVNGVKSVTYEIISVKGGEVSRRKVKEEIKAEAVAQVTTIGTKVATIEPRVSASCDPNYSGACVPIASDVDCGSGSGNGPAYLYGTANVVGSDIYDLDRDGDRLACE